MPKVNVYDLPTRVFHWSFAFFFIVSFSIGKFIDDESWLYAYHMLSGIIMVFLVILRVSWGFLGTKYAKFSAFKLNPKDLIGYFLSLFKGSTKRELGHNPASSYVAVFLFFLTFSLMASGTLMVLNIGKEFFEELHELFAFTFLIIVILHISGVIIHQARHKDGMISSMIDGQKLNVDSMRPIKSQGHFQMIFFIMIFITFITVLHTNFNTEKQTLKVYDYELQLGQTDKKNDIDYYNKYYHFNEDD